MPKAFSALAVVMTIVIAALDARTATNNEAAVLEAVQHAGRMTSLGELTALVRRADACCRDSHRVAAALTSWLHEGHPIYTGRLPTEAMQFRGFLLASLGAFGPSEELFRYVRASFLFADHSYNVAAAAIAARAFPTRGAELAPLMTPFLESAYDDEPLDMTTPELVYPPLHRTTAKAEITRTLATFGPGALSPNAALRLLTPEQRHTVAAPALKLLDQDGDALSFADLRGRPFVLTFFYSRCANAKKCPATLQRLSHLAVDCEKSLRDSVGLYAMTYDPFFDRPSTLREYGQMYGVRFRRNVRLLTVTGGFDGLFIDQLQLRVSYGAGSVNLHGVQLFIFDKKSRLAAVIDNDVWSSDEVKDALATLARE